MAKKKIFYAIEADSKYSAALQNDRMTLKYLVTPFRFKFPRIIPVLFVMAHCVNRNFNSHTSRDEKTFDGDVAFTKPSISVSNKHY